MRRFGVPTAVLLAALLALPLWFALRPSDPLDSASRARGCAPENRGIDGGPSLVGASKPRSAEVVGPATGDVAAEAGSAPPPPGIPLRVDTVDAQTGLPVAATWSRLDRLLDRVRYAIYYDLMGDAELESKERAELASKEFEEVWEASFSPSGVLASPGKGSAAEFVRQGTVRPPDGYVRLKGYPVPCEHCASGVREQRLVVPLAREAVLNVRLLGADGRAAERAQLMGLVVAHSASQCSAEATGRGEWRLRGIPFLPGEPVVGTVEWNDEPAVLTGAEANDVDWPVGGTTETELVSAIPNSLSEHWTVEVQRVRPRPSRLVLNLDDFDLDAAHPEPIGGGTHEEAFGSPVPPPMGSVRLRTVAWDGTPIAGVPTWPGDAATGADGRVRLERVVAREQTLVLQQPGRLRAQATFEVREGETSDVVLREPVGARLEVLVVDEEGRPRPTARVLLGVPWFDVVDGIQRLDTWTDHLGRRSFARVQPGPTEITAAWGSRRGSAKAVLVDGETTRLTIVAE